MMMTTGRVLLVCVYIHAYGACTGKENLPFRKPTQHSSHFVRHLACSPKSPLCSPRDAQAQASTACGQQQQKGKNATLDGVQ
ncbi:hypothetical protein TcBrA4_0076420 [Trypanosoma cruzi]|nr:hypothetical protein TcBrA4_0076420 [Trypanosoma cruzi]